MFLWFFAAMVCLVPDFKIRDGVPAVSWLFSIVCLLRILKEKILVKCWREFPLRHVYMVLLVFHFIQPFFAQYESFGSTYFKVIQYVMTTYLYVFLGFCMKPDFKTLLEHKRWIYTLVIVLFLIASISNTLQYNFIAGSLNQGNIWITENEEVERGFRVIGTVSSPNVFGYINVLFALFIFKMKSPFVMKGAALFCLLANVVLCGTRSPIFGLTLASLVYFLLESKVRFLKESLFVILVASIGFFATYPNETINRYIESVEDIIKTGGENTQGSTAELRAAQFAVAYDYGRSNPIWGKGQGYCNALQNENSEYNIYYDTDLAGAESYIFYLLIDYGFVYIGIVLLFYIFYFWFCFKNYKTCKDIVTFAIPVVCALLVHVITSRPANSWQIFMPLMGACLFAIVEKNKEEGTEKGLKRIHP